MNTPWWYLERSLRSKRFFDLTTLLSVVGLTLGVASLIVAMAVFSGYTKTLSTSVQNLFGHLVAFSRGGDLQATFMKELEDSGFAYEAATPFLMVESVLAHKGAMNGVVIEGVDPNTVNEVISLKKRLIEGEFDLSESKALIGKGVAAKFDLKVGDFFRLVIPSAKGMDVSSLQPKVLRLQVAGVLNFGRYDFDSRYVVTDLHVAQNYSGQRNQISGMRLRLKDASRAQVAGVSLSEKLGDRFWVRDWTDINKNILEAAGLEKTVTFFILTILVIVACFNLASQLIVGVVRRYQDIAVLKTCGAGPKAIQKIFIWQGLLTGALGCMAGFVLGVLLCWWLELLQGQVNLVPPEVYKLDRIELKIELLDLIFIFAMTLVISFFSTLIPARLGSRMSPVKGLRYD